MWSDDARVEPGGEWRTIGKAAEDFGQDRRVQPGVPPDRQAAQSCGLERTNHSRMSGQSAHFRATTTTTTTTDCRVPWS